MHRVQVVIEGLDWIGEVGNPDLPAKHLRHTQGYTWVCEVCGIAYATSVPLEGNPRYTAIVGCCTEHVSRNCVSGSLFPNYLSDLAYLLLELNLPASILQRELFL